MMLLLLFFISIGTAFLLLLVAVVLVVAVRVLIDAVVPIEVDIGRVKTEVVPVRVVPTLLLHDVDVDDDVVEQPTKCLFLPVVFVCIQTLTESNG